MLGLQWTVANDSLQVCRGTNKEFKALITQRKILSLVASVFDPIGLFALLRVHMRRLFKGIWTKNGQHWDIGTTKWSLAKKKNSWQGDSLLPIVAEASTDRRYFNRQRYKTEHHVFAYASEDTMCPVAYLRSQPKKINSWIRIGHWKIQSGTGEASFNTTIGITSGRIGSEVEGRDSQVKEHEIKIKSYSFWSDTTTVLQWIHSSHRNQQKFVANWVAQILDTTYVSQWKHVSGIDNPADIDTRAINIEDLRRNEWLTGPARLKRPENEWPEQVNLIFASDQGNISSSVFMKHAEEKEAVIQWARFSNRLVNTVHTYSEPWAITNQQHS